MGTVYSGSINVSRQDDLDYLLKCQEYQNYVDTHKANVLNAYNKLFVETDYTDRLPGEINIDDWNYALELLGPEVEAHDDSKYTDAEFEPYRRHFDKTEMEKMADESDPDTAELYEKEFDRAWLHHIMVNPHHPEFWNHTDMVNGQLIPHIDARKEGPRDMDLLNILHMICDWSGMSIKFRDKYSPVSWYNTQAKDQRAAMSANTRHLLYLILTMMFPGEEVIE